jgi:TfoX/Sxy family transcriptional regulator of competence genes
LAYDEQLAQRVRCILEATDNLTEMAAFGGLAFLVNGNIAVGVIQHSLIVRVGRPSFPKALAHPEARPFDIAGRPLAGWVAIPPEGLMSPEALHEWVSQGLAYATSLPVKQGN